MTEKKVEYNLEGLRGLAAFAVVLGHVCFRSDYLDPQFSVHLPGNYIPPGHFSVLIFFCLSGFVIGHTNRKELTSTKDIAGYLKKRAIRLYPIYLISILIVLPFAFQFTTEGIVTLLKHLTFSNIFWGEIYPQNNPLWSLNYEVLYYLAFIPLSFLRFPKGRAILAALALAFINTSMHTRYNVPLVTSYLLGLVFWLTGLKLSEYTLDKAREELKTGFILSVFTLVLLLPDFIEVSRLPKLFSVLDAPDSVPWVFRAITFDDLLLLPFAAYFILILTNTTFPFRRAATVFVYAVPPLITAYLLIRGKTLVPLTIPLILYGLSLLLVLTSPLAGRIKKRVVNVVIFSGGISYAVYVIHFPLLLLFRSIDVFSGTWITVLLRLVVFLFLLIAASVFLEKYMQPAVKRFFSRRAGKTGLKTLRRFD